MHRADKCLCSTAWAWWEHRGCHSFLSVNAARLPDVQGVQPVESLRSVTLGYYGQEAVVEKPAL